MIHTTLRRFTIVLFSLLSLSCLQVNASDAVTLKPDNFTLYVSEREDNAVLLAVEKLQADFNKVMGYTPQRTTSIPGKDKIVLMIVNEKTRTSLPSSFLKPLDDFESHRVWCDVSKNRIYLQGKDMRGTIYAIYTFSEQILGVPPLWYFCSWEPQRKQSIAVPADYDYYSPSPQVRYRAWFPNDQDMYTPWRKLSKENSEIVYETMLRLKLNTIEMGRTISSHPHRMHSETKPIDKYGLILTSHHMIALNNSWAGWNDYWKKVRQTEPPRLTLENFEAMKEFWRYNAETVHKSGLENLWLIAFRGVQDAPFWTLFKDSPTTDKERGAIASKMLRAQYEIIREVTGEKHPYVRITFYDEMSDLLAAGYLTPPMEQNMIWTFVAARRDHYPNTDLVNFKPTPGIALGYYMNFQFSSTGAHLAQAEGPWKMEANYRYVNSKAPLYFSVVNSGNQREFLFNLSANAAMMWNMKTYRTDTFVKNFCSQYFGAAHATEAADLYRDFFYSYWQQHKPDFPGMERQYIFQDLRYARAFEKIIAKFNDYSDNPLKDFSSERMNGRTFRIEGGNQVDSLIAGMARTYPKFDAVAARARVLMQKMEPRYRKFFRDNLYSQAAFMGALSRSMYHFVNAYKIRPQDTNAARKYLEKSIAALEEARDHLYANQEGRFETWYAGDATDNGRFNLPARIEALKRLKDKL